MPLTYQGSAYRQARDADAPWIISIIVPAEELLQWAAIPRRTEGHLLGFQRAADPVRVDAAKAFFDIQENQSPTSLIVGLHEGQQGGKFSFTLEGDEGDPIRPCTLIINTEAWVSNTIQDLAAQAAEVLRRRLPDTDELDQISEEDAADSGPPEEIEADADEDDDDGIATSASNEVELGTSVLASLAGMLESPEWITTQEELIRDLAKPGTIIDGQHRVLGAAKCERKIPFSVCVIAECPWPEQVFQFTVVNYTSRGIPDQFITANAALSLTGPELRGLEQRLVQAGVKVVEYELMRIVNFAAPSAFYELVNLSEKKNPAKIGYATMVRVAKAWQQGKSPVIAQSILPNLYPDLKKEGKRAYKRESLARWQSEDWGDFFLAFWDVVKDVYQGSSSHVAGGTLWQVGKSQLMIAVVLQQLQAAFMDNLAAQDSSFFEVDKDDSDAAKEQLLAKVRARARTFLTSNLPAEFFSKEWKTKSLSTGAGRIALDDALENMIKNRGKWGYSTSNLVTGKAN